MRFEVFVLTLVLGVQANAQRTVRQNFGDTLTKQWVGIQLTLADSVYLKMEGPANAWFALGFNTQRMQRGVDVCMVPAWKEAFVDLRPYDAVLTGYAPPKRDALQHWRIQSEAMEDGRRSFEMVRAIATGDEEDFDFTELTKNGGPLNVIWAMGTEKSNKAEYHGNQKGKKTLQF